MLGNLSLQSLGKLGDVECSRYVKLTPMGRIPKRLPIHSMLAQGAKIQRQFEIKFSFQVRHIVLKNQ